jgi:hypothetical protein
MRRNPGARSSQIVNNIKHYGFLKTFEDIALRLLNRIVFFKVLKCIKIDQVDPEFLKYDEKFRGLFLPEDRLRELANDPESELPETFLDEALAKGDECYGFLDGDALAAYGWYSNKPTESAWPDLMIHFSDQYIYMYKGLTHSNYRGQRLHAIGMTLALEAYLAQGYKGIVSYVESNNFGSLKSCYRMGYQDVGTVYAIRIFNHYFLHSDAGCDRYGFRLVRTAQPAIGRSPSREPGNQREASTLGKLSASDRVR